MKTPRLLLLSLALFLIPVLSPGCTDQSANTRVNLNQEFTLAIGQSAEINGENLTVRFNDVVEDSRCPKNVTCIWAGRVSTIIDVTKDGKKEQTVLTEMGLTSDAAQQEYQTYLFKFRVDPYPEAGKQINKSDYRLALTVNKK